MARQPPGGWLPGIDSEISPRRNRAYSPTARFMECVAFRTHPFQAQVSSVEQPCSEKIESYHKRKQSWQPARANHANNEECVLAIFLGNIKCIAMQVLSCDRKLVERRQYVPSDIFQLISLISADVEHERILNGRERVKTYRAAQTAAVIPLTGGRATTTLVKARRRPAPSGFPAGPQVFFGRR